MNKPTSPTTANSSQRTGWKWSSPTIWIWRKAAVHSPRWLVFAFLAFFFDLSLPPGWCEADTYVASRVPPPPMSREMRAAWVATVANIDWPSTNSLTSAQQKAELVAIMDQAVRLRLNTLIFQVRPACDALYASSLEPWSEYLTGTMGQAPQPFYDPLAFAIQEAHKRGLELHAWFDPYRARLPTAKSPTSVNHVSKQHPEYVRRYGKSLWLDPGEKAVRTYSLNVVMDVVKRYDIDGVHFDDYFYPYKEKDAGGRELDFPDESSWRRFGTSSQMSRDDWRRDNVTSFIQKVYESIKAAKPWVKFGVSPFGVWRPGNPPQIQGLDAYSSLYADSRQWLAKGYVDYLAPQLYWPIRPPAQSFPVLLKWWADQNVKGRQIAAGIDSTKAGRKWPVEEILDQVRIARSIGTISGHCHWNMKALMRNTELADLLLRDAYSQPSLAPALSWLRSEGPARPTLSVSSTGRKATWKPASDEPVRIWVLQTRKGQEWTNRVLPASQKEFSFHNDRPDVLAVTAVDRYGNSSLPVAMEFSDSPR